MKKIKALTYWMIFVTYEEILFSILIFNEFPKEILWIILLTTPFAIGLNIITSLFKNKINTIITYAITIIISFIVATQLIYYRIYESIVSFYSIGNGGQVAEFMTTIIERMLANWLGLILIFIPNVLLIIMHLRKKITFDKENKTNIKNKCLAILIIYIFSLICINTIDTEGIYSNKNLYYHINIPKITVKKMGLYTEMRLDLQRLIFKFEEDTSVETIAIQETNTSEEITYNITEIDFDKLIENETDEEINILHEYFKNQTPSEQNEYTGIFEGKNLIVIVAESLSNVVIREDLFPNLYKLYNEGFQFENYYTPLFPVSTADGEYMADTALLPKEGVWSIYKVIGNYMPYSYANIFNSLGYSSNCYHNHTANFYHRESYLKTMGYDSYLAVGNGLETRMNTEKWPNSDYDMIKVTTDDYINNDKFLAYYMSVSGHLDYNIDDNDMVEKNWDEVKDLEYSDKAKSYLATQKELDKAVGELLEKLQETNKLEDTVIVITPDHYPYGLTIDELNELSTYKRDETFEKHHTSLLIWSGSMKKSVKVEKVCSSIDVLPTVLNLFGVNYDSRLLIGNDILANNTEPMVIFSDRSFITEKGRYNSVTNEFIANDGIQVEEDYIEQINTIINQKFKISAMVLENDYYDKIFKKNS